MSQLMVPELFVNFNKRNQIINENCTKQKDISEIHPNDRFQTLLSYMPEKEIYGGILKRQQQAVKSILNGRVPPNFADYEKFTKGYSTNISKIVSNFKNSILLSHKSTVLCCGFNFTDLALLGSLNITAFDDTDLKAYWKFDETSGDIINVSQAAADLGSAADMQITGATFNQSDGPFGYSMLFDGVNDRGIVGSSVSQFNFMHSTTATWTMAFWMRMVDFQASTRPIFCTADEAFLGADAGFQIIAASNGNLSLLIGNTSSQFIINLGGGISFIPDTTNFFFYTITYDQALGSNNGTWKRNAANDVVGNKTANTPTNGDAEFAMDVADIQTVASKESNIFLTEVSNWGRVLTDDQITELYDDGNGREIY